MAGEPLRRARVCCSAVAIVTVRPDGSATAKYPNGSLAVSVDHEEGGYRLYAAFRGSGGQVAASFDSLGNGFANFSKGSTCFTTHRQTGGFAVGVKGGVEERWGGCGAGAEEGEEEAAAEPRVVCRQLDDALALRYTIDDSQHGAGRTVELLFR